jgi:hypothetical protein
MNGSSTDFIGLVDTTPVRISDETARLGGVLIAKRGAILNAIEVYSR